MSSKRLDRVLQASSQRWLKTLAHLLADRIRETAGPIESTTLATCAWTDDGQEQFVEVAWCQPWYVVLTSGEVWYFESVVEVEEFVDDIAQASVRAKPALAALRTQLRRRIA